MHWKRGGGKRGGRGEGGDDRKRRREGEGGGGRGKEGVGKREVSEEGRMWGKGEEEGRNKVYYAYIPLIGQLPIQKCRNAVCCSHAKGGRLESSNKACFLPHHFNGRI